MKTASLVFIVQDGAVLLGEKKHGEIGSGTLNGAGGKLEEGETIRECAARETHEEFGLAVDAERLEQIAHVIFYAGGTADFDVHVFRAREFEGALHETEDMHAPQWYALDALPFDRMLESDRMWAGKALAGEAFTAHVYYRERAKGFERIEFVEPDFVL